MTQTVPFDILLSASKHAVSERSIESASLIAVHEKLLRTRDKIALPIKYAGGNGAVHLEENCVCALFNGKPGSYDLRLKHPTPPEQANGITVRYRISGWTEIRYLAIGHSADKRFRHVKISNPSQGEWVTFSVGYEDLAYRLTNNWETAAPDVIKDIRVYISGTPSHTEARIEVAWASIWLESSSVQCPGIQYQSHPELFEALERYFQRCNPALNEHAELFLKTGACPMTGDVALPWSIDTPTPAALPDSGTYRYIWHAMQPAISLLVYGNSNDVPAAIYAARDYINAWLDRSYFTADSDTKYTWYDHGTAERLLAFLLMHEIGLGQAFDFRFMERLRHAIVSHGQLLESEAFYSRHQPTRYHNHAWFQDMALIAAGVAMSPLPCSTRWLDRAIERLSDQFRNLIARDGRFSIFVENSIGYHHGVQRLVDFASELVQLSGTTKTNIPETAQQLNAWSDFLRYPDKRTPSQGDTFRKPNPVKPGERIKRGKPYAKPSTTVLPKVGYAVVKGNHDNIPFMLCMFATSLSKTHKHEDDLSITLFFDGIEWLSDPSFYSHGYTEEIPSFLRSARAHNRIVIDGLEHAITPGGTRLLQLTDHGVITGQSDAYEGVRLTRSIKCGQESLSIDVKETISTTAPIGNAYLVFHCGEGVGASTTENQLTLTHPLSQYSLLIQLPTDANVSVFEGKSENGEYHGIAGAGFMQTTPTTLVRVKIKSRDFAWELRPSVKTGTEHPRAGKSNNKRELIIHAGLPKTGSTSLQDVLSANRETLLSRGILYPEDTQPESTKHTGFAKALLAGNTAELERWLSFDCPKCIISDESISNAFYHTPPESFKTIRTICKNSQIQLSIMAVDRDKEEWLNSYYKQCVLNQPSAVFDYYSTSLPIDSFSQNPYVKKLMNRDQFFQDMEEQLGGSLIKLTYQNTILPELLKALGIDIALAESPIDTLSNQSLPSDLVDLVCCMNATIAKKEEKYYWMRTLRNAFHETASNPVISNLANRCTDDRAYSYAAKALNSLRQHASSLPADKLNEVSKRMLKLESPIHTLKH
ncbi:MAG: heparinase II/III family protein [Pirellulaceae bacterium]